MSNEKRRQLFELIKERGLLHGKFVLSSGRESDHYYNLKAITLDPQGINLIADIILDMSRENDVKSIGGLASGAVPIIAAVSMRSYQLGKPLPGFFVRKEVKQHGTKLVIEGNLRDPSLIIDDVTTTGHSVMVAVETVRKAGCQVKKVISIVDRCNGAEERILKKGIAFDRVLKEADFIH